MSDLYWITGAQKARLLNRLLLRPRSCSQRALLTVINES